MGGYMSTISASTTTTTAYKVTADTTGTLVLQTGATPTTAVTVGSDQSVTFAGAVSLSGNQTTTGNLTVNGNTTLGDASTDTVLITGAPSIGGAGLGMGMGFRNRIINGAMVIDQRNAGASVTITNTGAGTYVLDRWSAYGAQASKFSAQQNAGSVTPPAGYKNYLGVTSLSAYSVVASDFFMVSQAIEGLNFYDFGWGSAGAQAATLSFWVRSSLTGTFGGNFRNNGGDRNYPFTYTISSANTWEQKTVTVPGDTSGTWLTTNGTAVTVLFGLGVGSTYSGPAGAWSSNNYILASGAVSVVGTNGATFYITGVQLEKGSTATSFDYRPYGTELQLCQRYLPAFDFTTSNGAFIGQALSTTGVDYYLPFPVTVRSVPTGATVSAAANFVAGNATGSGQTISALAFNRASLASGSVFATTTGVVAGNASILIPQSVNARIYFTGCEL
jgi:hypothetical protein